MICSLCRERAILSQPYFGRHLCQNHFIEDFERRVAETMRRTAWSRMASASLWP